jgi:hypothetical protein
MKNILYYNKHKYPTAKIFIGEEDGYKDYMTIFPSIFVNNEWDVNEADNFSLRQTVCMNENHKSDVATNSIILLDDCISEDKIYKHPFFTKLYKVYSRHGKNIILLGSQQARDFPSSIRSNASYIVMGATTDLLQLEKMYKMFGGMFQSFKQFREVFDAITSNKHTFMVIDRSKKALESGRLEDKIFFYTTRPITNDWKFGCKEYRAWNEARVDKNFNEADYAIAKAGTRQRA